MPVMEISILYFITEFYSLLLTIVPNYAIMSIDNADCIVIKKLVVDRWYTGGRSGYDQLRFKSNQNLTALQPQSTIPQFKRNKHPAGISENHDPCPFEYP
jgi:hypothetical protein